MDAMRWDDHPKLRRPVMIVAFEGWNDAADAASGAARYLADAWQSRRFADIDPEDFYDFTSTRPEVSLIDGLTRQIDWPTNILAAAAVPGANHDAVFLHGTEPQLKWRTYCESIVEAAHQLGVKMVISLGALLADVAHTRPVKVTGTAGDQDLIERLGLAHSRYEGPTGIVAVLHDAFARREIPSASLWAAVPHYVGQTPSPKATLALVERTTSLMGTSVDVVDLEIASAAYERAVGELVSADEEAQAYVARLEEITEADDEVPSAEDLAAEVENFLRDHPSH
ncbi:MAG: PAC2 family protein [Acidimicrobiales bacterium]